MSLDTGRTEDGLNGHISMERFDVVIAGAGPVGLMLATCISRLGQYRVKHVDKRRDPITTGHASGMQARTMELWQSLGLKRKIMALDPGKVYEAAFWESNSLEDQIRRIGSWKSCPSFIDTRFPYSTILNQGHVERLLIEDLASNNIHVDRPCEIIGFQADHADAEYPIQVSMRSDDDHKQYIVRTKYLFGAEGARSFIRNQLGIQMLYSGRPAHAWSVIDGVVESDFPDIKMKCTIQSAAGSAMIIPHGGNVIRVYVQIDSKLAAGRTDKASVTEPEIQQRANEIFAPYYIKWKEVLWFSIYPIRQGIAEEYTLDERIFIGGDACHTHSPKAGQGMNAGFLDVQNWAWKFHLVESGFANREILKTYQEERRMMAQRLVEFDEEYARLFSSRPPPLTKVNGETTLPHDGPAEESAFVSMHKKSSEFTSGYAIEYAANMLNWTPSSNKYGPTFSNGKLKIGRIFPPVDVNRVVNARVVHLEQDVPFNGSYRICVYAGNPSINLSNLARFGDALMAPTSFLSRAFSTSSNQESRRSAVNGINGNTVSNGNAKTDTNINTGSVHSPTKGSSTDFHKAISKISPESSVFTFCTIFNGPRVSIEIADLLPNVLQPWRDYVYADDIPDARVPHARAAAHAKAGFDEDHGGIVVVRPDGYVGCVVSLVDWSCMAGVLNDYFALVMAA